MTAVSVSLVVLASLIHATWNLLAKRASDAGPFFVLAYTLVSFVAYAPWVVYLMVRGEIVWTGNAVLYVVASGLLHLGYSLFLQRGYQKADLSVVYPVARGIGPLLSTLGALLILGETPTLAGLLGLFLVVGGIGLITTGGQIAAFRRLGGQAGLRWGTATGALIAAYTVVDAVAVKQMGVAPVVLNWFGNLMRIVLLMPLALADPKRAREAMRGRWLLAIGVGVLSPLAYILVLAALEQGAPLSVVAPMREMSMMVGALMGMVILRENVGPWRLAGCAILIGGVVLLSSA